MSLARNRERVLYEERVSLAALPPCRPAKTGAIWTSSDILIWYLGINNIMSSLIPILQDIIPMLRPGKVQVVKSTELDGGTGQTEGMICKGAIVGMSDHLCASGGLFHPCDSKR